MIAAKRKKKRVGLVPLPIYGPPLTVFVSDKSRLAR